MDHSAAPVLDALSAYHDRGHVPFTPPGHILDYLRTGVAAGMVVPDAVDTDLNGIRVLREA